MYDYHQELREATLLAASDQPPADKARAMNMMEAIIEGELSVDALVDAIEFDTLPVRYVEKQS